MKKMLALFLTLCLLFCLAACEKKAEKPSEAEKEETPAEDPGEEKKEEKEEKLPEEPGKETEEPTEGENEEENLWMDAFSEEGTLTNAYAFEVPYSYRIPAFREDSEGAKALNEAIMEDCGSALAELEAAKKAPREIQYYEISYEPFRNGDLVSFLLKFDTKSNDLVFYKTYNLNTETGMPVSGEELLRKNGYTEESFRKAAVARVTDYFEEVYGAFPEDEFYLSQFRKTVSDDAFGAFLPIFLNNEGELSFVAPVYALAGADYYETVFSLFG